MNKVIAIAVFLMLFSGFSNAQEAKHDITPVLQLGKIIVHGKMRATNVTRDELLANSRLVLDISSCHVASFRFSMLPKGNDFIGPFKVKGSEFTPQIIKAIMDLKNQQGKIYIEDILVDCGDGGRTYSPILLNMVTNKK